MPEVKYTLVSEGTSDQALIPVINWIFIQKRSDLALNSNWANPARFPNNPKNLADKIRYGLDFFPCDIVFIHRDSDNQDPDLRRAEIDKAYSIANVNSKPYICIIPVKSIEAWFLFSEQAIRDFVGNPNGREDLKLPKMSQIESTGQPKNRLNFAFEAARRSQSRRKKSYETSESLIGFAMELKTYLPLRKLPSFSRLEADIHNYVEILK